MVNRRRCRIWKGQLGRSLILLLTFCCVYGARTEFYFEEPDETHSSTGRCSEPWCGEKWRENRILYYNYTIQWRRENRTIVVVNSNCSEVSSSSECQNPSPRETRVESRLVPYHNRTLARIVALPYSSLGLITTDNIDAQGNFTGPTYPANQDKIWQIKIPHRCRLLLYFNEFEIESSPNCQNDNFSVQTRPRERDFHIYCNSLQMIEIRNRRKVQLWLHTDKNTERSGIHASFCFNPEYWEENDQPCSCNTEVVGRREARSTEASATGKSYSRRKLRELRKRAHREDELIGTWLITMMQSPTAVDQYLHNTANPKQQSLARKYQEALRAYSQDV